VDVVVIVVEVWVISRVNIPLLDNILDGTFPRIVPETFCELEILLSLETFCELEILLSELEISLSLDLTHNQFDTRHSRISRYTFRARNFFTVKSDNILYDWRNPTET
jgi:hypothetical protein